MKIAETADESGNWMQRELQRLARETERAQHAADGAMTQANSARAEIAAHERVCALRYETITTKLAAVPKINDKMDQMMKSLNIGVGVWLATMGLSVVVGIIYTIFHFAAKGG